MSLKGEIRMIKWGVIPSEKYFSIAVGQLVGGLEKLEVLSIVKEFILDTDAVEFHVECRKILKDRVKDVSNIEYGEAFVWKTYHKMPDEVQYFIPDEKHNYKLA